MRRRRALSWVLGLVAVSLVVGAMLMIAGSDDMPVPPAGVADSPDATPAAATLPRASRAAWRPGAPRRVQIPALEVDAATVPVEAPDRRLVPPRDAEVLGWWAGGALPGARRGSALVAGHTLHDGGGALRDLERLGTGDSVIVVTRGGRQLRYAVADVQVLDKDVLARRVRTLFSQRVPGRLVLLTCEDWDGTAYRSNVVVTARPI